jgi:Mn2+/Fe2+ NRAMP family transporter
MATTSLKTRAERLLALGPGIVFALTVLGPGDFISNAASGAGYQYALLWALAVSVIFRFVWLDTSARYVLSTGESLIDGYSRFGPAFTWFLFVAMITIRILANLYKVILCGSTAMLLLPLPGEHGALLYTLFFTALGYLMCAGGGYSVLERVLKVLLVALGAALVAAAVLARPDWAAVARGLAVPGLPNHNGLYHSLFLLLALIGTEAGSLTNVTYSYFVRRRGWTDLSARDAQRSDLIFSVGSIFVMSALVQIAAAGTLHAAHATPHSAADLVAMFAGSLGVAGRIIFAFGLCACAFSGFVGCTAGYALMAVDAWRKLMPRCETGSDTMRRRFVVLFCVVPLALYAPAAGRPVWLVLAVSALMAVLIPILAVALIRLGSDRQRLGAFANRWGSNAVLATLAVAATVLTVTNVFEWASPR